VGVIGVLGGRLGHKIIKVGQYVSDCVLQAALKDQEDKMSMSDKYASWQAQSARVRGKLQISSAFEGWTGVENPVQAKLTGVPRLPRMLDIIDCAWAARRLKHPE
jgi:hypothetical protein